MVHPEQNGDPRTIFLRQGPSHPKDYRPMKPPFPYALEEVRSLQLPLELPLSA